MDNQKKELNHKMIADAIGFSKVNHRKTHTSSSNKRYNSNGSASRNAEEILADPNIENFHNKSLIADNNPDYSQLQSTPLHGSKQNNTFDINNINTTSQPHKLKGERITQSSRDNLKSVNFLKC